MSVAVKGNLNYFAVRNGPNHDFQGAVFGDNNVILPSLSQQHDVIPFEYDEITPPCDDLGSFYLIKWQILHARKSLVWF